MIVHPTHGHYMNTLANAVVYHWLESGQTVRFRPVHRLDQETSGVLAIAKTPYTHHSVAEQMKRNEVEKGYIAIVYGQPPSGKGTVNAPIDRDPLIPHLRTVIDSGYPAVTHYEVVSSFSLASIVRLRLETGRTHQIRVHMKHIGCPLIGDKLYSEPRGYTWESLIERHALHAERLGFSHPVTGEYMSFQAEMPEDMLGLTKCLEEGEGNI
jgi:23S rRNA pseudouridine1911/1915/1917 synthase